MYKNIPCHGNGRIPVVEALMLFIFNFISIYAITQVSKTVDELKYELIDTQKIIINYLDFNGEQYWKTNFRAK